MEHFIAIDFETANGYRDSACSLGFVEFNKNRILSKKHYYIKPSIYYDNGYYDFNFKNTHIHGISWHDVEFADEFDEVWYFIVDHLESADYLVAHNYSFEKSVINQSCESFNIIPQEFNWLCTMQIARNFWEIYPTKLNDVCDILDIELDHHNALSDANASAEILMKAIKSGYKL